MTQKVVLDPKHETVNAVNTEMRFIGMTRIQAVCWMLRQFKFWAKALGPSVPFRKEIEWSSIRTGRSNVTQHAVGSMWTEGDRTLSSTILTLRVVLQEKTMSLHIYHQQQKHNGLKCSCVLYM
jgi:hypothetical protein